MIVEGEGTAADEGEGTATEGEGTATEEEGTATEREGTATEGEGTATEEEGGAGPGENAESPTTGDGAAEDTVMGGSETDELAATLTPLDRSSTHHGMKHYCAHVVTTLHSIRHACGLYIEQCMQNTAGIQYYN